LEPQIRDFLGGGMDLSVIISVEFMIKHPLSLFNFSDILSDTGSDESILEPSIGSFHFALGLGRKGIRDFHVTIIQNLFPLRGGLIGQKMVFSPDRISSLDESEDRMRIDIIGVRKSISKDDGLEGQDMGPTRLFDDQGCIEDETTIIIQRSEEIPFLLGTGCPEMKRGVMLNQFSDIAG
jgi:hypothetical protein